MFVFPLQYYADFVFLKGRQDTSTYFSSSLIHLNSEMESSAIWNTDSYGNLTNIIDS